MKKNLEIAIDFAKKISKKGILQIVLFGSVARGEDKADSDIDIAIVHNLNNIENLKSNVNKFVNARIQVTYMNSDKLSKETELVAALTGDGILLYGKPLKVVFDKKELRPYILMVYDTTKLDRKNRMLLNRALHGSVSVSKYKGKVYRTETKGVIAQPGIDKLTNACLLVEPKKAVIVRDVLSIFHAKFKEELIWK